MQSLILRAIAALMLVSVGSLLAPESTAQDIQPRAQATVTQQMSAFAPASQRSGAAVNRPSLFLADDDDDDSSQQIINGLNGAGRTIQCSSNCSTRQLACFNRCKGSYRNRDPNGVACVEECSADYNQCTSSCQ